MLFRELFTFHDESLWPILSKAGPEHEITERSKSRARFQCHYLFYELLPELESRLPSLRKDEIPEWLGKDNPQTVLDRISARPKSLSNMLDEPYNNAHDLLDLGNGQVSSPTLLAIQALLYYTATPNGEQSVSTIFALLSAQRNY